MAKVKFFGSLAGASMMAVMALGTGVALAGTSGSPSGTVVKTGTLSKTGTYTYPSTVQVTITSADTSLMPVSPNFEFANATPTFTPSSSYNGSGTFTLPSGFSAVPATSESLDTTASKPSLGVYVFDISVPTSMQSSTYNHLFIYSNYQWSAAAGEQPVDNYSTLVNLIQQLPGLPFAAIVPAVILGGWALKRRAKKNTLTSNA